MATAPIDKRLAAIEQRTLQPLLRIEPLPPPPGVEDASVEESVLTIVTGVPYAIAEDMTLDDLISEVLPPPLEEILVADEVVGAETGQHSEHEFIDEAPVEAPTPEPEPVHHSLVSSVRITPGASHISTGAGSEPVPLLAWIWHCRYRRPLRFAPSSRTPSQFVIA